MRYLLSVSLLFALLSCAPRAYQHMAKTEITDNCIRQFSSVFQRSLYRASVDVMGNHLSGIVFIKAMPDSITRIVFTNEGGLTFFDFGFTKNDSFIVYSIIDKMNKLAVIKTLQKDFELVLMRFIKNSIPKVYKKDNEYYYAYHDAKDVYYYIVDESCSNLIRMERGSTKRKVAEATFGIARHNVPSSIQLKHVNFNFTISLTQINDDANQ